jgi:hypothetical protein
LYNEEFHNSSIEGAMLGNVVLTNYTSEEYPFYKTNLTTLKENLIKLITNSELLNSEKAKMLEWKNTIYTPQKLVKVYEDYYDYVLDCTKKNEILPFMKEEDNQVPIKNESERILNELYSIFAAKYIRIWLLERTCLYAVKHKDLDFDCLTIGLSKQLPIEELKRAGYEISKDKLTLTKRNIKVSMKSVTGLKNKTIQFCGHKFFIPMPVVNYLKRHCKKEWEESNE